MSRWDKHLQKEKKEKAINLIVFGIAVVIVLFIFLMNKL